MNTTSLLALHGGTKTVTSTLPPDQRWGREELDRLTAAVEQSSIAFPGNGPQCRALIGEFQRTYPLHWTMPVSSATAALHVAIAALQLPPGSEIIVSALTDMSSALGALYQQCVPVFADIDPHSYTLDSADVRRKITPRTKAVIIAHYEGNPGNIDTLMGIAREHDLLVIEDCAQSWGATYHTFPVGHFGHIACYSFGEPSHLTCGEGGIVATNDPRFGPTLEKWRDGGGTRATVSQDPALLLPPYRMSELQAAVAVAQLTKLSAIVSAHIHLGTRLLHHLRELALPGISLPEKDRDSICSFRSCLLRIVPSRLHCSRDEFVAALAAEGGRAGAGDGSTPLYRHPMFRHHAFFAGAWPLREADLTSIDYRETSCPIAESVLADGVALTISPSLTDKFIDQTAEAFAKVARFYAM